MNPSAPSSALRSSSAWQALEAHRHELMGSHLRQLFAEDPQRFQRFSAEAAGILLDYSKNRITARTIELLLALAEQRSVLALAQAMACGERINNTENRAVLHLALRNRANTPIAVDGRDVMPEVNAVLGRMAEFVAAVHEGRWRGHGGQSITDVVNIGIGGSDLGPRMVCEALTPYARPGLNLHFLSNVDGGYQRDILRRLDPARTLFIVASKTFTTSETLTNARTARAWLLAALGEEAAVARHFVAVTTNVAAAAQFGLPEANLFPFWDWVGGRYSLWSAIGLPIALALGMERFEELLAGAHAMDRHFLEAEPARNLPLLLGLLGVWYGDFLGAASHAVVPYDQYLRLLPAYLQQLDMESNGKRVTRDGQAVDYATGPILWGTTGTDGQHAYFQLLHQGTQLVPVDFIAAARPHHELTEHHRLLLANCLAQSEALMRGKSAAEVEAELHAQGLTGEALAALLPHRVFPGNRPSNTLLVEQLTPATLGALIALYEHKVFVQAAVWGINAYDQWGVELGKQLARTIAEELAGEAPVQGHDASTAGLIARCRRLWPALSMAKG
ncbi:MAG TPA: glucose-6-phosphate isomerase [Candidatus Competibacteraceae bacterium]|nr:glucose-6-phosphate isomerase [Candidatus Competibacteraceae bacterium]